MNEQTRYFASVIASHELSFSFNGIATLGIDFRVVPCRIVVNKILPRRNSKLYVRARFERNLPPADLVKNLRIV